MTFASNVQPKRMYREPGGDEMSRPHPCTVERRIFFRNEAMARSDAFRDLARRLGDQLTENESLLLLWQAEAEWDDAIHIASADDPLVSLCGQLGRNLADLPDKPDSGSGCWTCLIMAEKREPVAALEAVPADA